MIYWMGIGTNTQSQFLFIKKKYIYQKLNINRINIIINFLIYLKLSKNKSIIIILNRYCLY